MKTANSELTDLKQKLESTEKSKINLQENLTKVKADLEESNGKTGTIESEIKNQKEQNTKLKLAQEKAIKLKDTEITKLESKIKVLEQTTGIRNKQVTDTIKKEFEDQIASKLNSNNNKGVNVTLAFTYRQYYPNSDSE